MDAQAKLDQAAATLGVEAIYLFGSRADDGLRALAGDAVEGAGSDLDVGVVFFDRGEIDWRKMAQLEEVLDEVFAPLRVDLVPLQTLDALFQYNAISGHRVAAPDSTAADFYELYVMSRAEELAPIQRQLELDMFGVSTT